jgi:hypothetical protein
MAQQKDSAANEPLREEEASMQPPKGSVRFNFADGEALSIPAHNLGRVFDLLWEGAGVPGSISAAALLHDASRLSEFARRPIELTATQSRAVRGAMSRLDGLADGWS